MKKIALAAALALSASILPAGEFLVKNGDVIAFLGDSITNFGNRPDGYVRLVISGLKDYGITAKAIPAGVNGHKSNNMLKRLPGILAKKPNILLISCGVNDVGHGKSGVKLPDFKINMKKMIDMAEKANVKVILLTPSWRTESLKYKDNIEIARYAQFIREEAAARKIAVADINKAFGEELKNSPIAKEKLKLTIDNVHLNGYGNMMFAREVLLTMGVPAKNVASSMKKWRKIPSMPTILNNWGNPNYKLSAEEFEVLYKEASAKKMTVEKYVWNMIRNKVKELKK